MAFPRTVVDPNATSTAAIAVNPLRKISGAGRTGAPGRNAVQHATPPAAGPGVSDAAIDARYAVSATGTAAGIRIRGAISPGAGPRPAGHAGRSIVASAAGGHAVEHTAPPAADRGVSAASGDARYAISAAGTRLAIRGAIDIGAGLRPVGRAGRSIGASAAGSDAAGLGITIFHIASAPAAT